MENSESQRIKVIFLGEVCTGKKSLINALLGYPFDECEPPACGPIHFSIQMELEGNSYILKLWDINFRGIFRQSNKYLIKDSEIVILVYDITNRRSFEELDYWFNTVKEVLGDTPVIGIIGNKIDLCDYEEVSEEKARKYAEEKKVFFKILSAKNNLLISLFLKDLLIEYIKKNFGKTLLPKNYFLY